MKQRVVVPSPVGPLTVEGDEDAVTYIGLPDDTVPAEGPSVDGAAGPLPGPVSAAVAQLAEYFSGQRRRFDLPLRLGGTAFQRQVWLALGDIPYGTTISYAELARKVGRPRAFRAVGQANGANPLPIVLPCHRVVASGGGLGGYGGGLDMKRRLLQLEGA